MKQPPHITITAGTDSSLRGPHLYAESITQAGGTAAFLRPGDDLSVFSEQTQGLLIPGGRDIDPSFYHQTWGPEINSEERQRTEFELGLLEAALKRGMPVLGICYGMQLINCFRGGSLCRDIGSAKPEALDHRQGFHTVDMKENPFWAPGLREVNSSHHQAVRETGQGLTAFVRSSDGIIEGLYGTAEAFLVGLQWHPERMNTALSAELFRSFLEAAYEFQ